MPETDKKTGWQILREFLVEIIALAVFLGLVFVLYFNKNFSNTIITNFAFLRPEYSIIWFGVLLGLTALLVLLFFLGSRKKKLKSTKKLSSFDKTLRRSDKAREMSQTQTFYAGEAKVSSARNEMPKNIDIGNANVVELYFTYEEKLNI